jgi:hypothetical protein
MVRQSKSQSGGFKAVSAKLDLLRHNISARTKKSVPARRKQFVI